MLSRIILSGLVWLAAAWSVHAAARTKVALLPEAEMARPGTTVWVGVQLRMPGKLHTYWQYGGDAGGPTTVEWQLPPGITAGPLLWPAPEKHEDAGLFTYVYYEEAILFAPLEIAQNAKAGPVEIKAKVAWLECEATCLPGEAEVGAVFTVGPQLKPSTHAQVLERARRQLPQTAGARATARWGETKADQRILEIEWEAGAAAREPDFYPLPKEGAFEIGGDTKVIEAGPGKWRLHATVKTREAPWPAEIKGVLVAETDGGRRAYAVTLTPGGAPAPAVEAAGAKGLWRYAVQLLGALVGGFILNFMPCVLPVISLKIMGFVNQGQSQPREVRRLGLIYAAGVLMSFLVLAGLVLAARAAGQSVSWGMQLQNPVFVIVLALVMTLIALNLFGVFEVMLGGGAMGAAASLASREGAAGAFFNGVLATFLATACTAPILGAAVGFAFAQGNSAIIVPFFLVIGLGLALPYVVLAFYPAWLKWMPRPGPWMERFKQFMGFPMLATAVWLISLAVEALGKERAFWLGLVLLLVALAGWIYGTWAQRAGSRRAWVWVVVLAAVNVYLLEGVIRWRHPPEQRSAGSEEIIRLHPNGIEWRRWHPEAVAAARAQGRPVLVDFTASWCLTCKVNAKTSLEIPAVREKLREINAVALLEDSYRKDKTVTEELARFGRAGVPLVLVYPRDPAQPPIVLPELLTPGLVLQALEAAAR